MNNHRHTKNLVLSGMFLSLALVLPFFTMQIQSIGAMLLPMHLPVILCGMICGGPFGAIVGFVAPLLRNLMFGMPPLFPTGIAMAFELMCYGYVSGVLYSKFKGYKWGGVVSLVVAMLAGRIVWAMVSMLLFKLAGNAFTWEIFVAGAFVNAVPGIILQLISIPMIMAAHKSFRKASI